MTAQSIDPWELLEELEARRLNRISRSLHEYCRYIDIPGAPVNDDEECDEFYPDNVTPAAHHDLLNEKLQQINDGDLKRLMVFMPPGSAKSTYTSTTFPTFYMGNHPGEPIILASYGSTLAKKFGRKCRQITSSDGYSRVFDTQLRADNRAVDDWGLTNDATFMCGGILSGMTGNRAAGVVIDDPVRGREDADSQTIRDKTWDAYQDDILTRLRPGGWQVIIQTRWHEDDLSGRILPEDWDGESGPILCRDGLVWEVLCIEAECTRLDDPLGREIGDMLWPDYFDEEHWAPHRNQSRKWASLFQQRPKPAEGALVKRKWIQRYNLQPAEFLRIVQSWDTAYKEKEINDPSVCTTWGETRFGYYLLHVFRDRLVYPDVKRNVVSLALAWEPQAVLIEDKASGQSLIQELREGVKVGDQIFVPHVIAIEPEGSKIDRLVGVSGIIEAGKLYLPEQAAWLPDYESELFGFPLTTHDDQVDSTSQFLKWAHESRTMIDVRTTGTERAGLAEEGRKSVRGNRRKRYGGFM
ncbi:MAG: phage terminase large subunit [Pseudomonadota bacterium]